MKAITAKKAAQIAKRAGIDINDNELTYYATDDTETEIFSFETKKERDNRCKTKEAAND